MWCEGRSHLRNAAKRRRRIAEAGPLNRREGEGGERAEGDDPNEATWESKITPGDVCDKTTPSTALPSVSRGGGAPLVEQRQADASRHGHPERDRNNTTTLHTPCSRTSAAEAVACARALFERMSSISLSVSTTGQHSSASCPDGAESSWAWPTLGTAETPKNGPRRRPSSTSESCGGTSPKFRRSAKSHTSEALEGKLRRYSAPQGRRMAARKHAAKATTAAATRAPTSRPAPGVSRSMASSSNSIRPWRMPSSSMSSNEVR